MKKFLMGFGVLLFTAATSVVVLSTHREKDAFLTPQVAGDFNAQSLDAPKAQAQAAPLARVGSSLTAPLKDAMAAVPAAKPSDPSMKDGLFQSFMSAPVTFIAKRTLLGKTESFEAFLRDPARFGRYMSHPLISGVLSSPFAVKSVIANPIVVQGFLMSPAMQNPRAVSALSRSSFLKQFMEMPGVQAALKEPGLIQGALASPQALAWFVRNPDAATALKQLAPAVAQALR